MQKQVYEHLQPGENDEDAFGMQVVVNEEDEVLGFNKRLLIGSTDLSIDRIVALIHEVSGNCNRQPYRQGRLRDHRPARVHTT